ncbi:MAG: hypothetical protein Ct9H300mP16_14130 [Pseudomonadota bacterium]|nr:MAG: hypothetical protein Ct9H300mP16_14130 [Pseudomonadota bacterium]
MIRSDLAPAGDIHAGYRIRYSDAVFITASGGLGNALYGGQSTRMNFTCTNPRWLGKPAILRRQIGRKRSK